MSKGLTAPEAKAIFKACDAAKIPRPDADYMFQQRGSGAWGPVVYSARYVLEYIDRFRNILDKDQRK